MNDQNAGAQDIPESRDKVNISRIRTQSECSVNSDDGAQTSTGKRQRTISQQYMVLSDLTSASPPKFVSLEEIMQAAKGIRDMALVHQIVVDEGFKLERAEPEANSIQKIVKDTVHKAFWDILQQELGENPPNYRQAMVLLKDLRDGLFSLLLPQHTKIKQQIADILDLEVIQQQANNGTLNFKPYSDYILSVMSKLCAPVRDERIQELQGKEDMIETFRGIMETLDLMHLDMANLTLQVVKPDIIAKSVELERKKFSDFLAIQPDGLQFTRQWLLRHLEKEELPPNVDLETHVRKLLKKAFNRACLDLLEWNESDRYPETFMLDEERLQELQVKTQRVISIATILLIALSNSGPHLQSISTFKTELKEHISILLQNAKNQKELDENLPNVAEQVINDIKKVQSEHKFEQLNDLAESAIRQQILEVAKSDHRIKSLIRQRIKDFFFEIIESSTAAPQQVPTGLSSLQKELTTIAGQFLKIVSHNSTVFGIYYFDIISAAIQKPN